MEISPIEFGEMKAQVAALREDVAFLLIKMDKLLETRSEQAGGWKLLTVISTAAGAVGAGVMSFLNGPKP